MANAATILNVLTVGNNAGVFNLPTGYTIPNIPPNFIPNAPTVSPDQVQPQPNPNPQNATPPGSGGTPVAPNTNGPAPPPQNQTPPDPTPPNPTPPSPPETPQLITIIIQPPDNQTLPANLAPAFLSGPTITRVASTDAAHPHLVAPDIDATGRWIVYASANQLPGGNGDWHGDVYLYDRLNPNAAPVDLSTSTLIAQAWAETGHNAPTGETYGDGVSISLDGRFVVFSGKHSVDDDGPGGNPPHPDSTVYIYDSVQGQLHVVLEHAGNAHVSGGGAFIAMEGDGGNGGNVDVLVTDQHGAIKTAVSANAAVLSPEINANGQFVTFETAGTQIDVGYLGLDGQQHNDHF